MLEERATPPHGTFWVLELNSLPAAPVQTGEPVSFGRAGMEDAEETAALLGVDPAEVRARLRAGRWCYAGRADGTLAVCGWVSFEQEEIGEQGLRVWLAPGEGYIWNCVTAPEHRRRGLYSALLQHIAADLFGAGLHRVWIGADGDNTPSHKGMARAGFTPVLDLYSEVSGGERVHRVAARPGVTPELLVEAQRVLLGGEGRGSQTGGR